MTATPNQEKPWVVRQKEKLDESDGWERGYYSPYYPKEREEIVLANIEKVSPAFVKGYKLGRRTAWTDDMRGGCEWYPYTGPK